MSKLWKVALYEYKRNVFQKRFILMLLSMPAIIALIIGLVALVSATEHKSTAIGYVDHAGLLANPVPAPQRGTSPGSPVVEKQVPLLPFQTEDAARQALEAEEIQAYYVIDADYFETNEVELVYVEPPAGNATRQFWDFMQINRLTDLPPEIASRAAAGSNLTVLWPDNMPGGGREFSHRTFLSNFVPLIIAGAFMFLLFSTSGYLMSAVVEEKESRTMEIMMTSLSPNQLITGKVVGIIAIALTQLVVWSAFAGLAVLVGGRYLGVGMLQNLSIDVRFVVTMAAIVTPAFVMVAALMTAVGSTVAEAQEAQQVTGLFILPFVAPLWFAALILQSPNSPLSIGLSLFPLTAVSTLSLRLTFAPVPTWQIVANVILTSLCALGALWLAGRAFRLGMLRYGQHLNWREILATGRTTARSWGGGSHE